MDSQIDQSDEALLGLFAKGDQAAARILTARHLPRIYALAIRMLNNKTESEDIAQEAMLRLWKIAPEWRAAEAKLSTWLYRITANLCIDRLRKRPSVGLDTVPDQIDLADSVETVMQHQERSTALHLAMDRLPERQKLALVMRHFEDFSNSEIAAVMHTSIEAVESLISRAKRTLANLLASKQDEIGL